MSLLGPTEEQLEVVRALHPVLAEVVDACTAPDADARPSFADIVPQLAKVRQHYVRFCAQLASVLQDASASGPALSLCPSAG